MAEFEIRDLANNFPNSYHVGIFVCCRELEKKYYDYYSLSEAINYAKDTIPYEGFKL